MIDGGIEVKENLPDDLSDIEFYKNALDALYNTKEIWIYGKGGLKISLEEIRMKKEKNRYNMIIKPSSRSKDLLIVKTEGSDESFSGYISSFGKKFGDFYIRNEENGETYRFMVKF